MTLEEIKNAATEHGKIVCSSTDDVVHLSCKEINEYIVDAFMKGAESRQPEIDDMIVSLKSIKGLLVQAIKLLKILI